MPEWLLKDENYIPQTDKDTFINKSILSLLGILSKIRTQSGYDADKYKTDEYKTDKYKLGKYEINASLKLFFTVLTVVLLNASGSFAFVITVNIFLLALLSLMNGETILKILKVVFIATAFTFTILLPSTFRGNGFNTAMITLKVFATVTAVNMFARTTKWNSITKALKTLFIPDIFILVLDITIKYIFLLGEFSLNMLYSLKLRSVGKNRDKNNSLSGIAGTMFIKSKEMAEDMYAAMECRGFTGEYRIYGEGEGKT